ncbi:Molybdopterin converting factor, small subunit [Amycolatopsis xylanica]|uniref:Molybdopterin converting factor, small subunit n=1 Tax=Amycolatopsis xylanica TaxID=589385 RepID=A0A1H2YJC0_9PSEU|nr:MoaD/ThiS family protein [Amycolatopsis xylanica]SDX04908.1 Molybdopterin converting factor, small subunit [Amycolatopsis xylanica]
METISVRVRYFASARAAAGVEEEKLQLAANTTVAGLKAELARLHPEGLPKILLAAGFLLDGVAVRDVTRVLEDSAEIDVLPPFAGG